MNDGKTKNNKDKDNHEAHITKAPIEAITIGGNQTRTSTPVPYKELGLAEPMNLSSISLFTLDESADRELERQIGCMTAHGHTNEAATGQLLRQSTLAWLPQLSLSNCLVNDLGAKIEEKNKEFHLLPTHQNVDQLVTLTSELSRKMDTLSVNQHSVSEELLTIINKLPSLEGEIDKKIEALDNDYSTLLEEMKLLKRDLPNANMSNTGTGRSPSLDPGPDTSQKPETSSRGTPKATNIKQKEKVFSRSRFSTRKGKNPELGLPAGDSVSGVGATETAPPLLTNKATTIDLENQLGNLSTTRSGRGLSRPSSTLVPGRERAYPRIARRGGSQTNYIR